jgi:PAS domain-containing protein
VSGQTDDKPKAAAGVFRRLADRLPDGVLLVSEDGEIAFASDSALRNLGAASEEDLREHWPELRQRIGSRLSESGTRAQHIVLGPGLGGGGDRTHGARRSDPGQEDDFTAISRCQRITRSRKQL